MRNILLSLCFFLIPVCIGDQFIMIIGGQIASDAPGGGVEKFDPNTMTCVEIQHHTELKHPVNVAGFNSTHAFVLVGVFHLGRWYDDASTYYIDRTGRITKTHVVVQDEDELSAMSTLQSSPQKYPIYCNVKYCKVLLKNRDKFEQHSQPKYFKNESDREPRYNSPDSIYTLSAFDGDLIALGCHNCSANPPKPAGERYRQSTGKWEKISTPPFIPMQGAAVKLNGQELLVCDEKGYYEEYNIDCFVYNLLNDKWYKGPKPLYSVVMGQMALLGQTVYAFGGRNITSGFDIQMKTIQTLDISNGVKEATWRLAPVEMVKHHSDFGVWVVDDSIPPETTKADSLQESQRQKPTDDPELIQL